MRKVKNHLEPASQMWVRTVEDGIEDLESVQVDIAESDRSQGIVLRSLTTSIGEIREQQTISDAQQADLVAQQQTLNSTQNALLTLATRVSEQNTGGSFDSNVNANEGSMGSQFIVEGPKWASRALIAAGAAKNTNPSNGWSGNIELIVKNSPVLYTDVGDYNNVLMIGIDSMSFVPQSNPLVVNLVNSQNIYMRPIGIYLGVGTRSVNYNLSFSFSITWI